MPSKVQALTNIAMECAFKIEYTNRKLFTELNAYVQL